MTARLEAAKASVDRVGDGGRGLRGSAVEQPRIPGFALESPRLAQHGFSVRAQHANVETITIGANSDDEAFGAALVWVTTLGFEPDDEVVLRIKRPDGSFEAFTRKDF